MDAPDQPADERPVASEPEQLPPSDDPEAPEADALEQAAEVDPGSRPATGSIPAEVSEADALEQAEEAGLGDDDDR